VLAIQPDAHTAIVALTHDPKLDDMALLTALNSSAFYVGALGSRRNQQARKQRLAEHFDLSEPALARLHGPVGLRLGAKTPAEIAVSIMAEIVQVKNKGASDARVEPRATDTTESPHPVCTV
jgi:xanthine dehydrogenase accessory factor